VEYERSFFESELSLWKPNVNFGTKTFIMEPEGLLWKPKVYYGTRTFIVETESSLRNPKVRSRVHKTLPLVQFPETDDSSTHRPVLFL
jgi:hypothetical protein